MFHLEAKETKWYNEPVSLYTKQTENQNEACEQLISLKQRWKLVVESLSVAFV